MNDKSNSMVADHSFRESATVRIVPFADDGTPISIPTLLRKVEALKCGPTLSAFCKWLPFSYTHYPTIFERELQDSNTMNGLLHLIALNILKLQIEKNN